MTPDRDYGLAAPGAGELAARGTGNLADVLERVLDKGLVVVGDIRVNLLDIELLTIRLRLLVASVDKAKELGIELLDEEAFVKLLGG